MRHLLEHTTDNPLTPQVRTRALPLHLSVSLFNSGLGAGITRPLRLDVTAGSLVPPPRLLPAWQPNWESIKTIGVQFLDVPEPARSQTYDFATCHTPSGRFDMASAFEPTQPHAPRTESQTQRTRVDVPNNALSIADRLFYLLQPPIETLLSGQELVMPFEPFPFQYHGIAWLFSHSSALLADEMGLGKTMQAISAVRLLLRAGQIRTVLLVCPKPLITNWQRELAMWAEEIPIVAIEGPSQRRRMLWDMPNMPVKIVNYEVLVRDSEMIGEDDFPSFDLVILDEAQRIKNRESRTNHAARSLVRQRSWALTGTPIENRPSEFVSLLEFIGAVPDHTANNIRQLNRLAHEFVLRRTKDRVLTDLPPRLDRDELLDLSPAQQLAYRTAECDGIVQLGEMGESITIQHVFELVLRLKQICNFDPLTGQSCKLDRLAVEMEEIAESGGKAILFSQWTRSLDWMRERLERFGPLIYHGGIPFARRDDVLRRFHDDPNSHLLLMSYGVGAVGLNLQVAGYVFLYDRWWNPAIEDQAINRAHRIGQKNPVFVTKFICRDTIEERIDLVLQQKRELFQAILGDTDLSNSSLSLDAQEIFGLFDLKTGHGDQLRSIHPPDHPPSNPSSTARSTPSASSRSA
jgi:SNF2 family DNA or RNA helicase